MRLIYALSILSLAAFANEQPIRELNKQGAALYAAGDFANAECMLKSALDLAQAQADTEALASISFNLAAVYRSQAKYAPAELLYRDALRVREAKFGLDHSSLVGPLRGLSFLYLKRSDFTNAEHAARRAAAIAERQPDAILGAATAQDDVVKVLAAQGRYQEANALAQTVLQRLDEASSSATVTYAETLNDLGVIARRQGRQTQAAQYLTQAVKLYETLVGRSHPSTAAAWNNLAEAEAARGSLDEAEEHFGLAISSWQAAYGPNHPDVATALSNLAAVYRASKKFGKAESYYQRALAIDSGVLGSNHPKTAVDCNNLGTLAFSTHKYEQAAGYFHRALEINRTALGPDHAETGLVSLNLAIVYYRRKKYLEAEPLFYEAIRIREQSQGAHDGAFAGILECYAQTLRANQKYADAAKAEVRATGIRVRNALHP